MVEINSKGVFAIKRLGAGSLEVFLARGAVNVDASQALRYCVFYEAMDAEPSAEMIVRRHDFDGFDAVCDHPLVVDHERGAGEDAVVGTYRLLRRLVAKRISLSMTGENWVMSESI